MVNNCRLQWLMVNIFACKLLILLLRPIDLLPCRVDDGDEVTTVCR